MKALNNLSSTSTISKTITPLCFWVGTYPNIAGIVHCRTYNKDGLVKIISFHKPLETFKKSVRSNVQNNIKCFWETMTQRLNYALTSIELKTKVWRVHSKLESALSNRLSTSIISLPNQLWMHLVAEFVTVDFEQLAHVLVGNQLLTADENIWTPGNTWENCCCLLFVIRLY